MRAILVSVEYGDLLAITLPQNRHHFEEVTVVTTPQDTETIRVARRNNARVFLTEAFYADGALFNKWLALEEGLSDMGRQGLLCIMDADVIWPTALRLATYEHGVLYNPQRYIWPNVCVPFPDESHWRHLQLYRDSEFPGYTQIFHADDKHLPLVAPWHEVDWRHAGGADSAFQNLWPPDRKVRLPWQVLHLGQPAENWAGRVAMRTDGRTPAQAIARKEALQALLRNRKRLGASDGYRAERLR